jgi:hypothetical protein
MLPRYLAGIADKGLCMTAVIPAARALVIVAATTFLSGTAFAQTSNPVPGTTCPNFSANSWWHADISKLPKHPNSAQWMQHMSRQVNLHPDFGPSFGEQSVPYGIPITIVNGPHPKVMVKFQYANESDNVPYPLGSDTLVEGGQWNSGDRHTVVVDRDTCRLYETWATKKLPANKWSAGSGATWDLNSNDLRPKGWTSADAAGLPILPGLLQFEEVKARNIDHAIRFTTDVTDKRFVWPARHQAGSVNDQRYPPMGSRFRLKASYPIAASLRADTKAVLEAMKKYGLVLADNGSPWFFQGTADTRWPTALLDQLKQVPASAFEAVDTSSLQISPNSMEVEP